MEILTAYRIEIFAALVVLAVLVILFFKRGGNGQNVSSELEKLGEDYTVLNGVVVPVERGVIRIPHVVVSSNGVFVVTVNNDSGKVRGRVGDRELEVKRGRTRETIYNPLWENRKQVNVLEKLLEGAPLIPVVVFTRAKLKSDLGSQVVRLSGLRKRITQGTRHSLSAEQIEGIVRKLGSERREGAC